MLEPVQYLLGAASGSVVGFTLGLVGGGGSILAVPLMVYLVGVASPHVAIGTSALAVAANAGANLIPHARQGTIKWRCAGMYAFAGVLGAYGGSTLGKAFDGQHLLFLFALLMLVVGALMLRNRGNFGKSRRSVPARKCPQGHCLWQRDGTVLGLLRHWRRLPDRAWPHGLHRHADD